MTIIKKFEPELPQKRISKKLVVSILACLFVLTLVQIWVSNTLVSYGEKFERLSSLEQTLKTANQILENEIAKKASLTNLATESAELGFYKQESIQYIR
ncbi:hypothetical protein HYS96_04735 [Candidatus Daviesbacteria bacterium]|nr:hypothetical protein [Candidatus Daviesbacteria bacterium]